MKLKHKVSLTAGTISALTIGYASLAPVWNWMYPEKVVMTGSVVVMTLSMLLSVYSGSKLEKRFTQQGLLEEHNSN